MTALSETGDLGLDSSREILELAGKFSKPNDSHA